MGSRNGLTRVVAFGYEETLKKAKASLSRAGLGNAPVAVEGVITDGPDSKKRYAIIGVKCQPRTTSRRGVFIPCNVAIYESGMGRCTVAAIGSAVAASADPAIAETAEKVKEKVNKAISGLK